MLYVPWDTDGKPYWMYVFNFLSGVPQGHIRIRSNDPTTFDYNDRETVIGLTELGNQIGYLQEAPGGPLFVRITFTNSNGRTVPVLQFSRDGLNWWFGTGGNALLEGSSDNNNNTNCYFLGFSTLNGTGQFEYLGNNQWKGIYAATTSNSPLEPAIYYSEIGMGSLTIEIVDTTLTTGVKFAKEPQFKVNIYPNPAENLLNVELKTDSNYPVTITLFNSIGESVLNKQIECSGKETLNLSSFSKGIYLVRVEAENNASYTQTIIIR